MLSLAFLLRAIGNLAASSNGGWQPGDVGITGRLGAAAPGPMEQPIQPGIG